MVTAATKLKDAAPWEKSYDKSREHIKKRDITWPTKVQLVRVTVFPVVMYGCKSWTIMKAEHQRIDAFELGCWKRHKSLWNWKETKPANSKGNQSWIFIGSTDAEDGTPIFWPPDAKN